MAEYISKEQLMKKLFVLNSHFGGNIRRIIEAEPTIDIVQCKGCKHYGKDSCAFDLYCFEATEESFCSYGEK